MYFIRLYNESNTAKVQYAIEKVKGSIVHDNLFTVYTTQGHKKESNIYA